MDYTENVDFETIRNFFVETAAKLFTFFIGL